MKTFRNTCLVVHSVLVVSKRFVRKRGLVANASSLEETLPLRVPTTNSGSASGFHAGPMLTAPPTTSLDRIQAEIRSMQAERLQQTLQKESRKMQGKDKVKGNDASQDKDDSMGDILNYYRIHNKPNDVYYKGKEVIEGLMEADSLAYDSFLDHIGEVMRLKSKEIAEKYVEVLFPEKKMQHHRAALLELINKIEASYKSEKEKLLQQLSDETTPADLSRLAWLNALNACDDQEVRFMWKRGILDADVIEDLLASPLPNSESMEATAGPNDEDARSYGDAEREEVPLLEETIQQIRECYYLKELTSSIRGAHFSGNPTCDIAPTLQKVKQKRFDEISEKELRWLEKWEEAPLGVGASSAVPLTESLLARALQPSNAVLFAVAQKDEAVRQSFEGLEQIKRSSLLDPEFQAALQGAHSLEELSVEGHVRPFSEVYNAGSKPRPDAATGDPSRPLRNRRWQTRRGFRGPVVRPYHVADVPYFYNSAHSIVPQRGNFNLPAPALSPQEKAALRGKRRRMQGRTRFGN